jgi:hypothetical protein
VGKVSQLLLIFFLLNLAHNTGLGIEGLRDAGVRIYAAIAASSHYFFFCLFEGSLLGVGGEVLKSRPGSTTMTSVGTSLLTLARCYKL